MPRESCSFDESRGQAATCADRGYGASAGTASDDNDIVLHAELDQPPFTLDQAVPFRLKKRTLFAT